MNVRLNQKARLRTGAHQVVLVDLDDGKPVCSLDRIPGGQCRFVIQRVSLERSGFFLSCQDGMGQSVVRGREGSDNRVAGFIRVFF